MGGDPGRCPAKEIDRMGMGSFVKKLMCTGLALCFISMATTSNLSYAQGQGKVKPEIVLPEKYPDGFDGWGQLDRISTVDVVIDDSLYKLAPDVEYHTPQDRLATMYSFKPGDLVGFLRNGSGKIVSLWLLR
jgi:hypothetical protein